MNEPDSPKAAPPDFSRRISVSQTSTGSQLQLMLLFMFVCVAGVMIPLANWLDVDTTGGRGTLSTLGMVVVMIVVVLGTMFVWFVLEERWRRWRGQAARFVETTQVDINAHGLSVMGLGTAAWHDVLAIEGVPDSESYLIVHTRPFDTLLLSASTDELCAVINHYMAL